MPKAFRPWSVILLVASVLIRSGGLCLEDGIPEADRYFLQDSRGADLPVGFVEADWSSAQLVTQFAEIVTAEVLGYRTYVHSVRASGSWTALYALVGCRDFNLGEASLEGCGEETRIHVALDLYTSALQDAPATLERLFPQYSPVSLGGIGYVGEEYLFVKRGVQDFAYQSAGLTLDYHRTYNASLSHASAVRALFDSIEDVLLPDLVACDTAGTNWVHHGRLADYVKWSGDTAGVQEVPGDEGPNYAAKCHGNHWWPSPACRHDISQCIPLLTSGSYGWLLPSFMHRSAAYALPVAIGIVDDFDRYVYYVETLKVLFYWWLPDGTFVSMNPTAILFPRFSAAEWEAGNRRTAPASTQILKMVSADLEQKSPLMHAMLSDLTFDRDDVQEAIGQMQAGNSTYEVACNWLRRDTSWRQVVPLRTQCNAGAGVVDREGLFLSSRASAAECKMCPAGTFSEAFDDSSGSTRRCVFCESGRYQPLAGETACVACEAGKISGVNGSTECEFCAPGSFANRSGLTECTDCGDERWTTSECLNTSSGSKWVAVRGAPSERLCRCIAGTYLSDGRCQDCPMGSICPGSGQLELRPGFYASNESPGAVFECHKLPERCPGGSPGSCARGRDNQSIACASCLPGWREDDIRGECVACFSNDYIVAAGIGVMLLVLAVTWHLVMIWAGNRSQSRPLVLAGIGMGQVVTFAQLLLVIRQFGVKWGEPFLTLLKLLDIVAFDVLLSSLSSIKCFAEVPTLSLFVIQSFAIPCCLVVVLAVTHVVYSKVRRSGGKEVPLRLFGRSLGFLAVLFFIASCSLLLRPFRCKGHPNGLYTIDDYPDVFCDGQGIHLQMCLYGAFALLAPLSFLSMCAWVIVIEFPRKVRAADANFVRAWSFLAMRFRPGAQGFAVVFLFRNLMIVLCPLLPSETARMLSMNFILYLSLCCSAYVKPWRVRLSTHLDLLMHGGALTILDIGALFVPSADSYSSMLACVVIAVLVAMLLLLVSLYGLVRHLIAKTHKRYSFFLCHHKQAAGSLARLLKIELQHRASKFKTFIDSDDLKDLSKLFNHVAHDVEKVVILGSPAVLSRKWCVGEMVTARQQSVPSLLITLPGFSMPDESFRRHYANAVGDIRELSSLGIGLPEVNDTLKWLWTLETLELNAVSAEGIDEVVASLTQTAGASICQGSKDQDVDGVILADPDDMEAVATALVLYDLLAPLLIGSSSLKLAVLTRTEPIPVDSVCAVLICSDGGLASKQIAEWLTQASYLTFCAVLPILVTDDFQFPSLSSFREIASTGIENGDTASYFRIIKAVFQEVALLFTPHSSSALELDLRVAQIAQRLQDGDSQPLAARCASILFEKDRDDEKDEFANCFTNSYGLSFGLGSASFRQRRESATTQSEGKDEMVEEVF